MLNQRRIRMIWLNHSSLMKAKIYIDGQAGTTALRIRDWLHDRDDLELLVLPEELRKDVAARKEALHDASLVVLCLPDDAARQAARSEERRVGKECRSRW